MRVPKVERTPANRVSPRAAAIVIGVAVAVGLQGARAAGSPNAKLESHGMAHDGFEAKADAAVESAFPGLKTPGLSVAVTQEGRLILTKGYGRADTYKVRNMDYMTRARIGSVSKAAFTGPSTVQLLRSKGIDPKTKTLYGPTGIFGTTFDTDILIGVKRFTPIVGIAIGQEDRVFAWYDNGMVSAGWSRDLDSHLKATACTYPEGKSPVDVRDMSIAKDGRVFVWYDDRTYSIGTPTDLGKFAKPNKDDLVKLPSGKSMGNILGIGIAKSNDHVYAWYDDGTVSSGYSRDFGFYFGSKNFSGYSGPPVPSTTGTGMARNHIRSLDIASNDHVYTWFSNDRVIEGMSDRLDRYRGAAEYKIGDLPPRRGPDTNGVSAYRSITIQNLLDHTSGFDGSGDTAGAARMFGVAEDQLTYSQIHRHFLRTRKLLYGPGTGSSYSNHGFGSCTMIVEKLSGKSFRDYVMSEYVTKMPNLGFNAVPESATMPTAKDAMPYTLDGKGNFVAVERKDSTLGLAAGGFMASARDLLLVTKYLTSKYPFEDVDSMGWFRSGANGKLEHNGKREGGTCYVAMFPKGYKSGSGVDLSEVHVAIVVNADTDTGKLEDLANALALAVPAANVPASFDVWKAKPAK